MPNWIMLTADNVRLMATEETIMANAGPTNDLQSCVLKAIDVARGYVSGGANTMEPAPAVPPEVADDVIAIARATYLAQDPTGTLLTPIREKERDLAFAHLRDVAKRVSTVTQGHLTAPDITIGKWGTYPQIQMRTVSTPPPATPIPTPP